MCVVCAAEADDNLPLLQADVVFESQDRFHLKIYDAEKKRWEVPERILPSPGVDPSVRSSFTFALFDLCLHRSILPS